MEDILQRDYTQLSEWTWLMFVLIIAVFGRYIVLSGLYQRLIYLRMKATQPNRILASEYDPSQRQKEIIWSGISSILFAGIGVLMIILWQHGWTQIYIKIGMFPIWYIPVSLILAMLVHETYYYWLHRWMHSSRKIYRLIHKTHHDSVSTSVWTSFSFHPIESILQAIVIPVILILIPMHWIVILVWLIMMTISAMINHAGVEIFPFSWRTHSVMRWFIGSSHHDIHHRRFVKNFGLYFTFWDIWMGTESEELVERWNKMST